MRREGAGQGTDGVQRRLWRNSFRGTDRNLGVSLHENEKKKTTRILGEETQKLQVLGEAAPQLSASRPRKLARFIKAKRSLSPVIKTGLIIQNLLMNAD